MYYLPSSIRNLSIFWCIIIEFYDLTLVKGLRYLKGQGKVPHNWVKT